MKRLRFLQLLSACLLMAAGYMHAEKTNMITVVQRLPRAYSNPEGGYSNGQGTASPSWWRRATSSVGSGARRAGRWIYNNPKKALGIGAAGVGAGLTAYDLYSGGAVRGGLQSGWGSAKDYWEAAKSKLWGQGQGVVGAAEDLPAAPSAPGVLPSPVEASASVKTMPLSPDFEKYYDQNFEGIPNPDNPLEGPAVIMPIESSAPAVRNIEHYYDQNFERVPNPDNPLAGPAVVMPAASRPPAVLPSPVSDSAADKALRNAERAARRAEQNARFWKVQKSQ